VSTGTVAARSSHDSHEISGRRPHRSASVIVDLGSFGLAIDHSLPFWILHVVLMKVSEGHGTLDTDSGATLWEIGNDLVSG
jgi:hypothetical protein